MLIVNEKVCFGKLNAQCSALSMKCRKKHRGVVTVTCELRHWIKNVALHCVYLARSQVTRGR